MHFDPPTCVLALAILTAILGAGRRLGRIETALETLAPVPHSLEETRTAVAVCAQRLDDHADRLRILTPKGTTP